MIVQLLALLAMRLVLSRSQATEHASTVAVSHDTDNNNNKNNNEDDDERSNDDESPPTLIVDAAESALSLEQWKEQVLSSAKQQQHHHLPNQSVLLNASELVNNGSHAAPELTAAVSAADEKCDGAPIAAPPDAAAAVATVSTGAVSGDDPPLSAVSPSVPAAAADADESVTNATGVEMMLRPVAHAGSAEIVFDQFNYAAIECGAKVLDANREASETSAVISRSLDHYMLNECGAEMWFAVELCEEIMVTAVMLHNAEFFSSMLRQVELLGSNSYPAPPSQWVVLARLELANSREPQRFILPPLALRGGDDDHFFKFVKLNVLAHYGSEFYCPLTRFAVHGVTLSHAMSEHLQHDSREVTELQSVIKTVDVPLHPRTAQPPPRRAPPLCMREDAALYFQRQCRPANAPLPSPSPPASSSSPSPSSLPPSPPSSSSSSPLPPAASSPTPVWTEGGVWRDLADLDDAELLEVSDGSFAAFRAANLARTSPRDFDMPLTGGHGQSLPLFDYAVPTPPPPAIATPDPALRNQIVPLRDVTVKKSQESIFRMLASRVKALEINQTLIDRYLEQLTKKYVQDPVDVREQLAESLRKCNAALTGAEKARERAERAAAALDAKAQEKLLAVRVAAATATLTAKIDALRDEHEKAIRYLRFDLIVGVVGTLVCSSLVAFLAPLCCSSQRRTTRAFSSQLELGTPVRSPALIKVESPMSRNRTPSDAILPRVRKFNLEPDVADTAEPAAPSCDQRPDLPAVAKTL